ncbi:hypothetical protein LRP67_07075 [Nocardioides sp. cx-169]|uniref:protein-tyrosine phosphatase family protein n=1 Tax=Nocardioides sp. cx-169 TaxID=2899080 RepID=UPI001E324007|nr:sulfur transferase domain-containing protein [Nocardioides sp. cx-169]MCD4533840.1 hypothetical protein [Nocardioides sp. cx-169]
MELFAVARDGAGTLSTMTMPSYDDLTRLAAAGVERVVCLLPEPEAAQLGLADEEAVAEGAGVRFHRLPVADFGVPDQDAAWALVGEVAAALADGEHVVVHCRGGIGRSSVLAAALLVAEGVSPAEAWARLTAARGVPVPETDEQRAFVDAFHAKGAPETEPRDTA